SGGDERVEALHALPSIAHVPSEHRRRTNDGGGPAVMTDERPIGMFDSGFGGLTVARAVIDLLPFEHLVYVGDTGRYPYGPRPLDEVRDFARQIAGHLIDEHDVKFVVVACNTASAAALED